MAFRPGRQDLGTRKYIILFFIMFGLIFVRYCYFGFEYFYQLDDYIQYHNYTAYSGNIGELIGSLGMLSSRPLAGLADLFVWSKLYGTMLLTVAIISAIYAASGILLHKVFSKHFGTGLFFFVIYALLPSGFEGAYWVSASSRIIVGLFFAALSIYYFDNWCSSGKKSSLVLFAAFQLICYCFYEQVLVFSAGLTLVFMLMHAKSRKNRAAWGFFMIANAALYYIITSLAPSGVYSQRTGFFFPWQNGYFSSLANPLYHQLKEIFTAGTAGIYGKGLLRSFKLLLSSPNIIWCIAVIVLCAALFLMARDNRRYEFKFLPQLLAGLFLAVVPILLFFIIDSPWFGLRNLVTSFCGFALVGSALLDLIFCRIKKGVVIQASIVAAVALLCCISSVSELYDYQETTRFDTTISKHIYDEIKDKGFSKSDTIYFVNIHSSYVKNGNFYFHEHNYGCTSSSWALTGAVRAISGNGNVPTIIPVATIEDLPVKSGIVFFEMPMLYG